MPPSLSSLCRAAAQFNNAPHWTAGFRPCCKLLELDPPVYNDRDKAVQQLDNLLVALYL
jgi:hypothetical protein